MKLILKCFVILSLAAVTSGASGQAIDNTLSFKNINEDRYFRLNYENDLFSGTDICYTQGIHLELVAPWVQQFPLSKLLFHLIGGYAKYGIGLEHNGYTPTSISSDDILRGDRPFAATVFLKTFQITIDPEKRQRFSSALVTGVTGPAAGGKEMQVGIHKALHDITPHGWQYQVHNNAVLNYQADYEKQLAAVPHYFSLDADAMARAGTLSDKAGAGVTLLMGYFESPFSVEHAGKKHLRAYAYEHAAINIIGYDATLEGGMFTHNSPYTIGAGDITRVTFANRFGFVVNYRKIYLEYFQSLLSNEFKTGNYHVWGGLQVGVGF